ncbi:MAG: hypothetical protein WBA89_14140 [Microcoleus sp.]
MEIPKLPNIDRPSLHLPNSTLQVFLLTRLPIATDIYSSEY